MTLQNCPSHPEIYAFFLGVIAIAFCLMAWYYYNKYRELRRK